MINIEVLYPDAASLFGDMQNIRYLGLCLPEAEIIYDEMWNEPYFSKHTPDLVYMGNMTESAQIFILENLLPYKKRLGEMIKDGVRFLLTGNAFEIFGKEIIDTQGNRTECLDLIPTVAKHDMKKLVSTLYLGRFEDSFDVVGFKSQFGCSYVQDKSVRGWFDTVRGTGLNPKCTQEGVRINNFYATYLSGPLLPLNPLLCKRLLADLGCSDPVPAFEQEAMLAYNLRRKEYSDPSTKIEYGYK